MLNRDLLYKTAENMGVKIDDDAFRRFDIYAELLFETNKKFNLTAITEPDDMTVKHFADCLSVFKYVDFKEGARLIDVGTGAGFPGLVLLLARPDLDVTFLDGTGKKLAFIESVLSNVGLFFTAAPRKREKTLCTAKNLTLQRQGLWRLCPSFANIAYLLLKREALSSL